MIKDILVNLSVGAKRDATMGYALSVASAFNAHLAAVAYDYELVMPGIAFDGTVATALLQERSAASEKAAADAVSAFQEGARRAGLSVETRKVEATMAEAGDYMGEAARTFDLSIVGQSEPDDGPAVELVIEGALFGSGRPVIVVPYIQNGGLKLDHVTLCWDGSRAAARAVADALPLLRKSKKIEVLIVDTGGDNEMPGADIAQHLARHGLSVEVSRIAAPDIDVADAIVSHVADSGSDFMVMGGYGHSRLREFVLGGVTRGILKQMTLPTLMSH